MKSYKHLFERVIDETEIKKALKQASKGKRTRHAIKRVLKDGEKYVKKLKAWLIAGDYTPVIHKAEVINDGVTHKKRVIIQPYFYPELWTQRLIVNVLKDFFMHGMYELCCGSVPKRGVHYGKKYLEKYIRNNPKNIKYVLKFDIHHFYQSINVDILKEKFKKYIHDERMLRLIFYVLDSNSYELDGEIIKEGLPIGFYTSQWFANWYLQDFDRFIKYELKPCFYIRYMDDCVIMGSNKRVLHKMLERIGEYLSGISLKLKSNYQIFKFDYTDKNGRHHGRFIDFMGFKFYRNKTTIRGSIFLRAVRKARKISKKQTPSWYEACQIFSYLGWFYATNSYMAYKAFIKGQANIGLCKKVLSLHFFNRSEEK